MVQWPDFNSLRNLRVLSVFFFCGDSFMNVIHCGDTEARGGYAERKDQTTTLAWRKPDP